MPIKQILKTVMRVLVICSLPIILATPWQPLSAGPVAPQADSTDPPVSPVKLVFIHHSCGSNWLATGNGGLGNELGANNYYVSDTSYGWGTDSIGSSTDIGHWWTWFRGPSSATYTQELYDTTSHYATYTRPMADPGGENEIVMFKSCYPNSKLGGSLEMPFRPLAATRCATKAVDRRITPFPTRKGSISTC